MAPPLPVPSAPVASPPRWTPPRRSRLFALALSVLITGGLGLALVRTLEPARERRPSPPPLRVVTVRGAAAPAVPPAPPVRPQRLLAATIAVPPPPIRIAPAPPAPHPPRPTDPTPAHAAPATPAMTPIPDRVVAITRPRPPGPPPGDPNAVDTLEGRIRRAVQNALQYPASARVLGEQGRALVGFDYRDSNVSAVRLLVGSGDDRLDVAALRTVRDARYPPPGALAGRTLALAVWVSFRIDGDGDDAG